MKRRTSHAGGPPGDLGDTHYPVGGDVRSGVTLAALVCFRAAERRSHAVVLHSRHAPASFMPWIARQEKRPGKRCGEEWSTTVGAIRGICAVIALGGVYSSDILQEYVDRGWEALIEKEWFLSVYFETWWTVLVYTTLVVVFMLMSVLPLLTEFKLNVAARPKPQLGRYAVQFFLYVTPIFALDAFTVKHYAGVPREALPRTTWLIFSWATEQQTTRIFPSAAPRVWEILWHMVAATVLYDLFFCTAHFVLHKVPSLYQHLHKSHHSHPQGMLADVTGQLALAENLADILLANLALKLVGAHPMTRFLYVPILLLLLVDNHAGFDFPWNYHRVVPFGVCGGGPAHFDHHQKSAVHYQPFFTYLNPLLSNL